MFSLIEMKAIWDLYCHFSHFKKMLVLDIGLAAVPLSLWEGVLSLIITMAWTSMFAYVYAAWQHLQVDGPKRLSQWHQQLNIPCYKFLSSSLGEVTSIWTCMYIHLHIHIVYIQSHTRLCIGLCIGLVLAETCLAQWLTLYNMYGSAFFIPLLSS